jgi:hypothetical protein
MNAAEVSWARNRKRTLNNEWALVELRFAPPRKLSHDQNFLPALDTPDSQQEHSATDQKVWGMTLVEKKVTEPTLQCWCPSFHIDTAYDFHMTKQVGRA